MSTTCKPACDTQAPTPNRHADLMRQYTEELILDPQAWRNWEHKSTHGHQWKTCEMAPGWHQYNEYRRKVKTIHIGDMDVPEPLREAPPQGTKIYLAHPHSLTGGTGFGLWTGGEYDIHALNHGMLHLTLEAAQQHGKALIAISGGTVD